MTTKQLRAWYARHLFCTVDGSDLMRRGPQPPGTPWRIGVDLAARARSAALI